MQRQRGPDFNAENAMNEPSNKGENDPENAQEPSCWLTPAGPGHRTMNLGQQSPSMQQVIQATFGLALADCLTENAFLNPNDELRYMKNAIGRCAKRLGNEACVDRAQADVDFVRSIGKLVSTPSFINIR